MSLYLDGSTAPPAVDASVDILALLGDRSTLARRPAFHIEQAADTAELDAYRRLRRDAFVHEQGLFTGHDLDDRDADPRTLVLVAKDHADTVVGGVRLGPVADGTDIGWWTGGRLVVAPGARGPHGIGPHSSGRPAPGRRRRARCASTRLFRPAMRSSSSGSAGAGCARRRSRTPRTC